MSVRSWRLAVGQPCADQPTIDVDYDAARLMHDLIAEESGELLDALADCVFEGDDADRGLPGLAHEIGDLLFVTISVAELYGLDWQRILDETIRANMTKLVDGKAIRNSAGKVMKPPGWQPPNMAAVIEATKVLGRNG